MTPDEFCKKVQRRLRRAEREIDALHRLLEDGVKAWGPELTRMGVDVAPLSGGTPKPDPNDED